MISIVMITYNHEQYIGHALESILNQQTEYDYEVIIGEDCSTDNTYEVILQYAERFGERLVLLKREKNLGMLRNVLDCLNHCSGKYIAMLEGDDYWIDQEKLQKQVRYMEQNPQCIMTTHSWLMVDKQEKLISNAYVVDEYKIYSIEDYCAFRMPGQSSSWLVRNNIDQMRAKYSKLLKQYFWIIPDRSITLILLLEGEIHILPDTMSAYRYVIEKDGKNWSSKHEREAKHNYIYFFCQMLGIESMAKKQGLRIELYKSRRKLIRQSRQFYRERGKLWTWIQGVLMILLEPQKVRFVKELCYNQGK